MAILNSCCCCGLRRGCYVCGIFSMIYFFVFSWMSGSLVIVDTMDRLRSHDELEARTLQMSGENTGTISDEIEEPITITITQLLVYVLSVVDFVAEVLGFFCSIVLLIGLRKDRSSLLIPWLILAPLHAVVDTVTVVFIILGQIEEKSDEKPLDVLLNHLPLLLLVVALNTFTIYMTLCIASQYQEYKDGRGLGSYDDLARVNGPRLVVVNHDGSRGVARTSNGNRNQSLNGSNEKSDIWLEDLMLDKLDNSSRRGRRASKSRNGTGGGGKAADTQQKRNGSGGGDRKGRGSVTVRFDTSTTDGGGSISEESKVLLKPFPTNSRSSPSGRSNYSSSGFEESTAETVAEF